MSMKPTDISDPEYFHKVVDCQWACPAHTPVPEYIRLIASGKYTDAYMLNWESNVFPGVLGRTCDRPCEPACRRVRVEDEPVAICRLKRVAADYKDDVSKLIPGPPKKTNGKKIALLGAGPVSLATTNELSLIKDVNCEISNALPLSNKDNAFISFASLISEGPGAVKILNSSPYLFKINSISLL